MTVRTRVADGDLQGGTRNGIAVFRGIPYAAVRARLRTPEPTVPWRGVRDATSFGPPPPQSGGSIGAGTGSDNEDDWLTVNVWSPDLTGSLPVMVWIHGGGYLFGRSDLPEYDGATLARDDVVVVTFNYRVGFEGFGHLDSHPPNRGLLDQVAALQWVADNIAAFGGDPRRVTVFGQSAGAGSLAALLVMPKAAGLFQRAIVQSMPGTYFTPALAADITDACADALGCRPGDLDTLHPRRLATAGDRVLATMDRHIDRWGLAAHANVPFSPVIDGDILPTTPWHGLGGTIDLLVGHTRHEQRLLTALAGQLGSITQQQADETAEIFAPDPQRYQNALPDPEQLYDVVRSDWLFRMPSLKLAEAHLTAGGRTHVYELTWTAPGMEGILGACHGLDVPLVFGNLTVGQTALLIGEPTPQARDISQHIRTAWTAFAATGDPGWATFDADATQLFDSNPIVADYPEQLSRSIWTTPPDRLDLE